MSRERDIAGLQTLSQLMLDHRLARLRAAAERREQSRMQIAALAEAAEPADLPPVAASQVALRYQLWADARRSDLNSVLARQTVEWLEARQDAEAAFGRTEALRRVARRLDGKR